MQSKNVLLYILRLRFEYIYLQDDFNYVSFMT